MKIYFAGSIRGSEADREVYFAVIENLKKYGEVLTEHVGSKTISGLGEKNLSDKEIYNRDLKWLKLAEVVVADVSTPSLGVGYELAKAEELKKKILCIYKLEQGKLLSAMISGNDNFTCKEYKNLLEAIKIIEEFVKQ